MIDLDAIEARYAAWTPLKWSIAWVGGAPSIAVECSSVQWLVESDDIEAILTRLNQDGLALVSKVRRLQLRCEVLQAFKDGVTLEVQT